MCVYVLAQIWVKAINDLPQFSDYKGQLGDFDSGVEYFLNLFLSVNENPDKVRLSSSYVCVWLRVCPSATISSQEGSCCREPRVALG
jgi:hypothetical protein